MAELNSSPEKSDGKPGRKKLSTRVDLTAMVDLAFLLVTFFMLTTALTKPKAMNIAMPVDDVENPVAKSRTMTVCIGANNKAVWYLGMPETPSQSGIVDYSTSDLRKAILDNKELSQKKTGKSLIVLVKPSDHSQYANLVNTIDELNITEIPSYAIVDITDKDVNLLKQKGVY